MATKDVGNEKRVLTRILLKNDLQSNWDLHGDLILKKGEAAVSLIPGADNKYEVMMKIGDGSNAFADLNWVSALAADVHPWAKTDFPNFVKNYGNVMFNHLTDATGPITHTTVYNETSGKIDCNIGHKKVFNKTLNSEIAPAATIQPIGYGDSFTIKVPKLSFDAWGHIIAGEEVDYQFRLPSAIGIPKYDFLLEFNPSGNNGASIILRKDDSRVDSANFIGENVILVYRHDDTTIGIKHAVPANFVASAIGPQTTPENDNDLTVVRGIVRDEFGHVIKAVTGTEHSTTVTNDDDYITVRDTGANGNHVYHIGLNEDELTEAIGAASTAAMVFKGCITSKEMLETAKSSTTKTGDFYKIGQELTGIVLPIHAGGVGTDIYTLNVGDAIVYDANISRWHIIPAGDDIEDTWRPVYNNGAEKAGSTIGKAFNFVNGTGTTAVVTTTGAHVDVAYNAEVTKAYVDGAIEDAEHTHGGSIVAGTGKYVTSVTLTTDGDGNAVLSGTEGTLPVIPVIPVGTGTATIATKNADNTVTLKGNAILNDHTLSNGTAPDVTLHKVVVTGSFYDLDPVASPTTYLIFDCGSATEVI